MPTTRKSSKRVNKKLQPRDIIMSSDLEKEEPLIEEEKSIKMRKFPAYLLIAVIIILGLLAYRYKGLFVAAMVNGKPISTWELMTVLKNKYGSQALDNLIEKRLILDVAAKDNISVSPQEIDNKMKDLEARLAGKITLEELLKNQGMTRSDFQEQVMMKLVIDKMFSKEATVSDKEIDDFILNNKAHLEQTTDTAKLRSDVAENLRQQKVGNAFEKWFTEIKQKAKITKFD